MKHWVLPCLLTLATCSPEKSPEATASAPAHEGAPTVGERAAKEADRHAGTSAASSEGWREVAFDLDGLAPRETPPSAVIDTSGEGLGLGSCTVSCRADACTVECPPRAVEAAYLEALEDDPDWSEGWLELGIYQRAAGRRAEADDSLQRAITTAAASRAPGIAEIARVELELASAERDLDALDAQSAILTGRAIASRIPALRLTFEQLALRMLNLGNDQGYVQIHARLGELDYLERIAAALETVDHPIMYDPAPR